MTTAPRLPTAAEIQELARGFGMTLTEADAGSFRGLMAGSMASYARLDELAEPKDNPLNAWYWRCEISGAATGPLAGKKVAVKDNICVAGVPMMNGSRVLEGYVPDVDATVVTRILDAGGTIVGKAAQSSREKQGTCSGRRTVRTGPSATPRCARLRSG
jgi:amidase